MKKLLSIGIAFILTVSTFLMPVSAEAKPSQEIKTVKQTLVAGRGYRGHKHYRWGRVRGYFKRNGTYVSPHIRRTR